MGTACTWLCRWAVATFHELTTEGDVLIFSLASVGSADRGRSPVTPRSAMNLNLRGQTRYYDVRDYVSSVPRSSRLNRPVG